MILNIIWFNCKLSSRKKRCMQKNLDELPNSAAIGILMLDTIFPRIPGDVGNPDTFAFPVKYKVVKGASPQKVVVDADPHLLQPFITAAHELVETGANAISTSCGYLAIFHRELVHALDVPVFTSSLLQVHIVQSIIERDQKVGIITAGELVCLAGATAGLHATQKNDYPITVMRGHSVSELILSKEEIGYTGIDRPSTIIALGQAGVNRRKKIFAELTPETLVLKAAGKGNCLRTLYRLSSGRKDAPIDEVGDTYPVANYKTQPHHLGNRWVCLGRGS